MNDQRELNLIAADLAYYTTEDLLVLGLVRAPANAYENLVAAAARKTLAMRKPGEQPKFDVHG